MFRDAKGVDLERTRRLGEQGSRYRDVQQSPLFSAGNRAYFVAGFYLAVKIEKREGKTSEIFLFLVLLKTTERVLTCNTKFNRLLVHKVKYHPQMSWRSKIILPGYSFVPSIYFLPCPVGAVFVRCNTQINCPKKPSASSYGATTK